MLPPDKVTYFRPLLSSRAYSEQYTCTVPLMALIERRKEKNMSNVMLLIAALALKLNRLIQASPQSPIIIGLFPENVGGPN